MQNSHNQSLKSLFVISLPRSLSCMVYHASRRCLDLREPSWTSDGEFLNADRFALLPQPNNDFSNKFVRLNSEPALFRKVTEFLNQVIVPSGFAYKDVVQPFVVAEWVKFNKPPTIKLRRNIADVAYSMLQNHWHYPKRLFPGIGSVELAVIQGLLVAQDSLNSAPGHELEFDRLIYDETLLENALFAIYGCQPERSASYIDDNFRRKREEIMKRRGSPRYQTILAYVEEAKRNLNLVGTK